VRAISQWPQAIGKVSRDYERGVDLGVERRARAREREREREFELTEDRRHPLDIRGFEGGPVQGEGASPWLMLGKVKAAHARDLGCRLLDVGALGDGEGDGESVDGRLRRQWFHLRTWFTLYRLFYAFSSRELYLFSFYLPFLPSTPRCL
jgi:hypothetical protein